MMKSPSILADTLGARRPSWLFIQDALTLAVSVFLGVVVGYTVAHGRWKIACAALASLLLLQWPVETALGVFLFSLPFDSINIVGNSPDGTPLTWFTGAGATVVLLATACIQRRWQRPPRPVMWWSLMMVWAAVTYFWALQPSLVAERLPTSLSLLVLFIAVTGLRITSRELASVKLFAIAGGVAAASLSASAFFSGVTFGHRGSLIMSESSTNPNVFAASLLLPLALAVGWLLSTPRWSLRFLMLGAISAIAFGLFLTMSRGSLVAVGVMLLVFLLRMRVSPRLIAPAAVVVATMTFMPENFFLRLHTAVKTRGAGRLDIWMAGLAALKRYGMFGGGLNNFPLAYNEFAGYASRYEGLARDPHNIYIGFWVEAGIVGMLLFFVAVRGHLSEISRIRRDVGRNASARIIAVEAACWSMLAASFFENTLWQKAFWAVWMLAAMTVTVQRDARSAASDTGSLAQDPRWKGQEAIPSTHGTGWATNHPRSQWM